MASRDGVYFLLLNIGHFLDHFFLLIFATAAALALTTEWNISYAALIPYATPGFVAFGLCALPAGWLADRWSRDGMMTVFFFGIGLMSIATAFANSPVQIGVGLLGIGVFAAIYHPVGLAIVTSRWRGSGMRIAVNGVWGNLGVGCAALITGVLISHLSWRFAFALPGTISCFVGLVYWRLSQSVPAPPQASRPDTGPSTAAGTSDFWRISAAVFVVAILGAIIFQSTTFALPEIFDERLGSITADLAATVGAPPATVIGFLTFVVFATASLTQLLIGFVLDTQGPRIALVCVAAVQVVFFLLVQGQTDLIAFVAALGFMLGVFGQIPINDYLVGKLASGPYRARVFGLRYLVSFTALALTLPLVAVVHDKWGFDVLFLLLAGLATLVGAVSGLLPKLRRDVVQS